MRKDYSIAGFDLSTAHCRYYMDDPVVVQAYAEATATGPVDRVAETFHVRLDLCPAMEAAWGVSNVYCQV